MGTCLVCMSVHNMYAVPKKRALDHWTWTFMPCVRVGAGNQPWVLWESSQCALNCRASSPGPIFNIFLLFLLVCTLYSFLSGGFCLFLFCFGHGLTMQLWVS